MNRSVLIYLMFYGHVVFRKLTLFFLNRFYVQNTKKTIFVILYGMSATHSCQEVYRLVRRQHARLSGSSC